MDSAGLMQRKDIMDQSKRKLLALNAAKARLLAVQMVHDAASGHPGGSLSCLDALTTLYFDIMHVDPANPRDPDRDRFVMSKGHCSPALCWRSRASSPWRISRCSAGWTAICPATWKCTM